MHPPGRAETALVGSMGRSSDPDRRSGLSIATPPSSFAVPSRCRTDDLLQKYWYLFPHPALEELAVVSASPAFSPVPDLPFSAATAT